MAVKTSNWAEGENGAPLPSDFLREFKRLATIQNVAAGQYVLMDGDESRDVYIVISGEVEFALFSESGKKIIFRKFGPNSMFGEMAALNGAPRSTSVLALSDLKLARISGGQFCALLKSLPDASFWLNQYLAARVENITQKTYNLATQSVASRIIADLLRQCEAGQNVNGSAIIENFPVHSKIAERLGTHRETISREISKLKKEGLVKKSGGSLVITSLSRLRALHARHLN